MHNKIEGLKSTWRRLAFATGLAIR